MGCALGKPSAADEREPGPQVFTPGLRQPSKEANFRVELSGKVSNALEETLGTLRTRIAVTLNGSGGSPSGNRFLLRFRMLSIGSKRPYRMQQSVQLIPIGSKCDALLQMRLWFRAVLNSFNQT